MKKNASFGYITLVFWFVLLNVLAFVIPTQKTPTFWTAYVFTVIAFALQFVLWYRSIGKTETLKSKFLGIPIVHIGIVYLIVQLIAFAIFMAAPTIPTWVALIVCAIIFAIAIVCCIAGQMAVQEIDRVEQKVKIKRFYIQSLQVDVEMLAEAEADADTRVALKKLAEDIRYSDPMSHEMLGDLESRISAKVEELKAAADKKTLIAEINTLLTERNKKCKILK